MTSFPFPSQVIQPDAEQAARRLRLPFSCCAWKGTQGHWEGTGAGNSIDFQGSRSYQWGDDPRDIHWAAYARTGQLTMKVFRAELSPQVDVAVDVSESMFFHEERAARTRGLLQFCLLSAIGTGAQVKIHAVKGRRIIPLDQEDVLSGQWEAQLQSLPPDESMPSISIWRPNGMKIFISDLLYPGEPDNLLETMAANSSAVTTGVHLMFIAKNIERIGDHATNIAENIHLRVRGIPLTETRPRADGTAGDLDETS